MAEVSVIIPAYNRAGSIIRAIESVLAQTFEDIEIIVVDDASTDDTVSIVEAYDAPRLRLQRHDVNQGASAARNTGIAASTSPYVAFLDSDDVWMPEKLAVQLQILKSREPKCLVSCTGVVLHLLDRYITTQFHLADSDDWVERMATGCDQRPGSTLLAKRQIFDEVGPLDTNLPRFEDWDWLLRYVLTGRDIAIVSEPLAEIYNTRGRVGYDTELSADLFLKKHAQFYVSLAGKARRRAFCDLWLQIATTYALEGHLRDCVRMIARAFPQRPAHVIYRLLGYVGTFAALKITAARNTH